MRKLLGIFDTKRMTPEEIFEKTKDALQEKERLELLELAKKQGKKKKT